MKQENRKLPIGIDLGTTYCCVAVYKNGQINVIHNDRGDKTTPSCVAFTDTDTLGGDKAKEELLLNPTNTVYDTKRLIGLKFDYSRVQTDMKHWPFKLIETDGDVKIEVMDRKVRKTYSPVEISSKLLTKMKDLAKSYLRTPVSQAVITVPANFNDAQRRATIEAARMAGLEVLQLVNEPTAAALAFKFDEMSPTKQNVLVFDLGGVTLDISILRIDHGTVEVLTTGGNTHLGGNDFDIRLANHLQEDFQSHSGQKIPENGEAIQRLRMEACKAKHNLSFQ